MLAGVCPVIDSLYPVSVATTFPLVNVATLYCTVAVGTVVSLVTIKVLLHVETLPAASVTVVTNVFAPSFKLRQLEKFTIA